MAPNQEYHIGRWQVSWGRKGGHGMAHLHHETDRVEGVLYPRLQWQAAYSATVTTYETEGERVHLDHEEDSLKEGEFIEDEGEEREEEEWWAQGGERKGGYFHGSSVPVFQCRQATEVSTQEHIRNSRRNQMAKRRASVRAPILMPGKTGAGAKSAVMVSVGVDMAE
ncbi:hypothetical protein NDU88_006064 [Pleurodeles waltl]|uniref:Uncharacterized protein n=1 Tax=Pleurodeles waltl TaxID=8319 RepID=A0AAV7VKY6_PLEWA|nr:hypothetical protein NDU88_006064 [Pleurodeles waltl]